MDKLCLHKIGPDQSEKAEMCNRHKNLAIGIITTIV